MSGFGLTSTLFRARRLGAAEIAQVAGAGFSFLELIPAAGHLDVADASQLDEIVQAAAAASLRISSLSVPVEAAAGLLPLVLDRGWPVLTARIGPCRVHGSTTADVRSLRPLLETLLDLLPTRGCSIAIQSPGGRLVSAEATVELLDSLEDPRLGVCVDVGHAHLAGGAPESIEALSGLVMTAILHDNDGREDLHRAPGEGAIDWPAALTECWKTGFAGPWLIHVVEDSSRPDALARAVGARTRLQAILDDLAQPMMFTE